MKELIVMLSISMSSALLGAMLYIQNEKRLEKKAELDEERYRQEKYENNTYTAKEYRDKYEPSMMNFNSKAIEGIIRLATEDFSKQAEICSNRQDDMFQINLVETLEKPLAIYRNNNTINNARVQYLMSKFKESTQYIEVTQGLLDNIAQLGYDYKLSDREDYVVISPYKV